MVFDAVHFKVLFVVASQFLRRKNIWTECFESQCESELFLGRHFAISIALLFLLMASAARQAAEQQPLGAEDWAKTCGAGVWLG